MELVRFFGDVLRELHDRTPESLVVKTPVLLVGAGGVGAWTGVALVLSAGQGFRLGIVDDDRLEVHNLNRLPYPVTEALRGTPKAEALYKYLKWLRPHLDIAYSVDRIDTVEKAVWYIESIGAEIVVDAVDNVASIEVLKKAAKETGADYLGLHYDGTWFTIEWAPAGRPGGDWVGDEAAAGYRTVPSCAYTPMFVASLAAFIAAVRPRRRLFIRCSLEHVTGAERQTS